MCVCLIRGFSLFFVSSRFGYTKKKMLIGIISVTSFRLPQIHASSTQILYQTTKSSETTGLKMILQDFRIWRKYAENETFSGIFVFACTARLQIDTLMTLSRLGLHTG